jgi:hypothetical protein
VPVTDAGWEPDGSPDRRAPVVAAVVSVLAVLVLLAAGVAVVAAVNRDSGPPPAEGDAAYTPPPTLVVSTPAGERSSGAGPSSPARPATVGVTAGPVVPTGPNRDPVVPPPPSLTGSLPSEIDLGWVYNFSGPARVSLQRYARVGATDTYRAEFLVEIADPIVVRLSVDWLTAADGPAVASTSREYRGPGVFTVALQHTFGACDAYRGLVAVATGPQPPAEIRAHDTAAPC